jgi:hypothetical protein
MKTKENSNSKRAGVAVNALVRPDFASTVETATFWRTSISECLRAVADWLEQEGLAEDENIDAAQIVYDDNTDQWGVTIAGRCAVGQRLISEPNAERIHGNTEAGKPRKTLPPLDNASC